jgi:hypothetical protein
MRFDITVVKIEIVAFLGVTTIRSRVGTFCCHRRSGSDPNDGGNRLVRIVDNRRQSAQKYTKVYSVTAQKTTV